MKTFRFPLKLALLSVLATLLPLAAAAQTGDVRQSKTDLHQLIATANTAADHQKLADYYKEQAQQAEADAAEHEQMLKAYAENPSTSETKSMHSPEAYCREMIRIYKREAQLNSDLAMLHERMAKDAPQRLARTGK
jgi:predicted  nucleic acid-binding Zn-ribbon protein